jgi:hypothetical protein
MSVFKYHAFIFFMRPPRWRYGTHLVRAFSISWKDFKHIVGSVESDSLSNILVDFFLTIRDWKWAKLAVERNKMIEEHIVNIFRIRDSYNHIFNRFFWPSWAAKKAWLCIWGEVLSERLSFFIAPQGFENYFFNFPWNVTVLIIFFVGSTFKTTSSWE